MHRSTLLPRFGRIAAIGVAALLVLGSPGASHAHGSSWFGDRFHGHGRDYGRNDNACCGKRNGSVRFPTHGRGAHVRPSDSRYIRITLRVGDHCSQVSMTPRVKKTVLLFP